MGSVARVLLGLVLLVAGALKLGDRAWPRSAAAFGLGRSSARAVPVVEIGLGALVVPGIGEPWSVLAATVLIVAFSVAVAAALARGRNPVCACFGSWSRRPVGWATLVRNLGLVGLGSLALVG